ncbi:MAG: hypothetical protein J6B56_05415 [Clostridia bacterium]|nr:hypothetical protein [Clostridia bacterium]
MSKASKNKNGKVPKITEAEYAAYVSALKSTEEEQTPRVDKTLVPPITDQKNGN